MADFYDSSDPDFAERVRADAEALKQALAETLARKHPDNVGEIDDSEYQAARVFLANFGYIFTLSYDLLLYWALMQEMDPEVASDDGFRADPDEVDAEWVVWDNLQPHNQNVFFMHGGLHLYDEGAILKKLTFSRTGIALVDQIRTALDQGAYPLVVTEGSSPEKLAKILHHTYLGRGLRSLAACQGSLFVHGHSLAENDAHIFRAVADGRFKAMFVSLHGDPDSEVNSEIQARARALGAHRPDRRALAVHFYDADSAAAWG
jgi:hypothetical protein